MRSGSLLAYSAIQADLRDRDIGEREITERHIGERDIQQRDIGARGIGENVATCRFDQQLLIQIHIRGVSGCLSFSQSWHRRAGFLRCHKPPMLHPTEGMRLWSSWSWVRLWGLWPWGRRRRF